MGKGVLDGYIERIDDALKSEELGLEHQLLVQEIASTLNGVIPGITNGLTCYKDNRSITGSYANGLRFPRQDLMALKTRILLFKEAHADSPAKGWAGVLGTFLGSAGKEMMDL